MQTLAPEAVQDYILLGLTLPAKMMLSSEQIGLRVAALMDLGGPTMRQERILEKFCKDTLHLSLDETILHFSWPWPADPDAGPELSDISSETAGGLGNERDGGRERYGHRATSPDRADPVLALFVTNKGQHGLKRGWQFHPYDDDPYPSVPHGHGYPKPHSHRLDPYLGFIHSGRNQIIDRESRSAIQRLWRSSQWRDAARKAILYKLDHDATFASRVLSDRNITNPMRLPRVR